MRRSASSAGRIWSGTSPPTARGSEPRRSCGAGRSLAIAGAVFAGLGRVPRARQPCSPHRADHRARTGSSGRCSSKRRARARRRSTTRLLCQEPAASAGRRSGRCTLVDGVEPTNNHAERGLRGAVIYRKLLASAAESDHGERTIERLLSASVTCRLQGRSLFAYLTDILTASIRGDPIPLLA